MVPPRVAADLAPTEGSALEDGAVLDGVVIGESDGALGGCVDLSLSGSRLAGLRLTGVTWESSVVVDTVIAGCELSGATLADARWERVEVTGCRMSGLVAPELRARNVRFVDCQLDGAWLRSAMLDRCAFERCDLTAADLLGARMTDVRFVDCRLDEAELSSARTEGTLALHGSTFTGARGLQDLRNLVIAHDQALPLALPLLAAHGVTVDDAYLDPPPPAGGAGRGGRSGRGQVP